MSELVKELNDSEFSGMVESGLVLVDFWAPWCGPCMMQAPILEAVASKVSGKATIAKINVDQEREVAQKYEIMSIPTLLLFKQGQIVERFTGLQNETDLVNVIERYA